MRKPSGRRHGGRGKREEKEARRTSQMSVVGFLGNDRLKGVTRVGQVEDRIVRLHKTLNRVSKGYWPAEGEREKTNKVVAVIVPHGESRRRRADRWAGEDRRSGGEEQGEEVHGREARRE
jgi:hypothetical protein